MCRESDTARPSGIAKSRDAVVTTLELAQNAYVDALDLERDGFGYWLSGLADGESCFLISPRRNRRVCRFTIVLRDDDHEILEEVHRRTRIGALTRRERRADSAHTLVANPSVTWDVRSKCDVYLLTLIFDRYPLRAKKAQDFAIWRLAVAEWQSVINGGSHDRLNHDWSVMELLRQRLIAVRAYDAH